MSGSNSPERRPQGAGFAALPAIKACVLVVLLTAGSQATGRQAAPYATSTPLTEPRLFADGAITTRNGIAFSLDGRTLYTSQQVERRFDNDRHYAGIFRSRYQDGAWEAPEPIRWDWDLDAYYPVLSADGRQLFFNSRSDPDRGNASVPHDIWRADRTSGGWSRPRRVEGVNSDHYDSYPSVARNGSLYFNSDRPGGLGGMDFYVSHLVDGVYQSPIHLERLSSPDVENDLVVDPDERFVVFNRYFDATRTIDLFVSFREAGEWSAPEPLAALNREDRWELTPTLSPDGRYFFFEVERQILQVDLAAVLAPFAVSRR